MYTWPDATLRELTDLVKEVRPDMCGEAHLNETARCAAHDVYGL